MIENVAPAVDGGRFAVKHILGCPINVTADLFLDGHDKIAARILWRALDDPEWQTAPMALVENDRWEGSFIPTRLGRHVYTIEAWRDAYASWRDEVEKKRAARQTLDLALAEGLLHLRDASANARSTEGEKLAAALAAAEAEVTADAAVDRLFDPHVARLAAACDPQEHRTRYPVEIPLLIERLGAAFASWYELFPRSETSDARQHGTLLGVIGRLPAIRDMGFDVLYFPPIHPIGRKNRKGRNNALTAGPDEPGSPYAIGSEDGGHDAIHPELGTLEDFRRLRDAAAAHGIELALDFAIQCSPDHPWLTEHPEWFAWRPDGSIRYAENPPKRYEDIVNVDFYAEGSVPALWLALRDVVLTWAAEGVRLFRVDNPHTKPLPFWEWMIADVTSRYPDVVFLSEAFTKPKMMYRLAKVGFSQSYTYFTWRNDKGGLTEYLSELTQSPVRDYFRPHFFVNTPDINPIFLQTSGRPGFLIRAALATTLSGLWGMYSGFELCEADPLPGKEEYQDSEKYEIKPRDWQKPGNIIDAITQLNRIRKANPALRTHLGLKFYNAFDDRVIYYGKATPARDNAILVLVNLDPFNARTFSFELPLWEWGLGDNAALAIDDLLNERTFLLEGKSQWMTLDPHRQPYAIWRVRPAGGH
ncbi:MULTISPECIES: alpha-1,4-glucan--maltose-1-phosphate maltosyltransferase [unclassified Chelatococcus]|uniref:alpha-1,4-glucan--maltose-1-phosphate maltosyltransferase n=1 Tax=unclassified Chelatococcus TaxID=2638111 RepID=UPI001BCB2336|nr:alpha-1,4-glucan--maltose-1-phosphate maltosyltransferase [Chelatococcus sp.]MBS7696515.1 alpha-1,4-glucan--maltose-1-phosphate maltosyltransferase [Chelatococcus sp. YT9]MBX3555081.1 alpha-1,4-glucan--maltose-1-phosphate maltosyltransferase [Chelatococcus sp.]